MACLDTDLLISFLRGDKDALEAMERTRMEEARVRITAVNQYELLKGAQHGANRANLGLVRRLVSELETLPLDEGGCEAGAGVYARLREKGQMVNEFDVLIAGIVLHNEETLITRDSDFKRIAGLRVKTW